MGLWPSRLVQIPVDWDCRQELVFFFYPQIYCTPPDGQIRQVWARDGPAQPGGPDYGTTVARITIGSYEGIDMGGSLPSIAIFNEFGVRIGQTKSRQKKTIPGSFKDIVIRHRMEMENVRPAYLLLAAEDDPVCISSVALTYPDGNKQVFTGTDLGVCDRPATSLSRTFFGPQISQPDCFWLTGLKSGAVGERRLSFHLPDFVWNKARRDAYDENRDLACRDTPRFSSWNYLFGQANDVSAPIPIFNPPIDYDPQTQFDLLPERNLKWDKALMNAQYDFSDVPFKLWPGGVKRKRVTTDLANQNGTIDFEAFQQDFVPFTEGQVEEERIRTEPPQLVISMSDISAQHQCLWGEWDHIDYVSVSEQIYCDMQSRSMLRWCNEGLKHNCWNHEARKVQAWEPTPDDSSVNSTAASTLAARSWSATGALYGYVYHNVTMIS